MSCILSILDNQHLLQVHLRVRYHVEYSSLELKGGFFLVVHFARICPSNLVSKVVLAFDLIVIRVGTGNLPGGQIMFFELDDIVRDPGFANIVPAHFACILTRRIGNCEGFLAHDEVERRGREDLTAIVV